jgi:hypothetical protein
MIDQEIAAHKARTERSQNQVGGEGDCFGRCPRNESAIESLRTCTSENKGVWKKILQ